MKKNSLICIFLIIHLSALSQGIDFIESMDSWEAVVEKSKAENKPIFVDVYTEWCGPCKWMDQNVFNQSEVGECMNSAFINVKVDAEKGWGVNFKNNFGVAAYPTYLFFSPEGGLIYNSGGSVPTDRFIKLGTIALENLKNGISTKSLDQILKNKEFDSEQIKTYLTKLGVKDSRISYLLDLYLAHMSEEERRTQETINLIRTTISETPNINSLAVTILLEDYLKKPIRDNNLMGTWFMLSQLTSNVIDSAGAAGNMKIIYEVNDFLDQMYIEPILNSFYKDVMQIRYAIFAKNEEQALAYFNDFLNKYYLERNADTFLEFDEVEFSNYLALIHPNENPEDLNTDQWDEARKRYFGIARIQLETLQNLHFWMQRSIPDAFAAYPQENFIQSYESAVELYESNPIYAYPQIIENAHKAIDRLKGAN